METLGTQYAEAMISSLTYTLGRTSSAIVDRREVKIKPRGSSGRTQMSAKKKKKLKKAKPFKPASLLLTQEMVDRVTATLATVDIYQT